MSETLESAQHARRILLNCTQNCRRALQGEQRAVV